MARAQELPLPDFVRSGGSFLRQQWVNLRFEPYRFCGEEYDRIYFVHARKSGGTSINSSIIEAVTGNPEGYRDLVSQNPKILWGDGKPVVGWDRNLINRGAFFYGFGHRELAALRVPSRTFMFTFLREPMERVLSYYNMLLDLRASGQRLSSGLRVEVATLGRSFEDFLRQAPRRHIETQLYLFDSSYDVDSAILRLSNLNFVGVTGISEGALFKELRALFGLEVRPVWLRKSTHKYQPTERETAILRAQLRSETSFYTRARDMADP